MKSKKILVISSNPMSNIYNNGKTLAAFFDNYPKEKLAQLYFSAATPDSDICSTYFRISDVDMLNFRLRRSACCGQRVDAIKGTPVKNKDEGKVQSVKKNNLTRLSREILWNSGWKTKDLHKWLDEFNPDIVFFLAGDVLFGHKICRYIVHRYNIKMAMYITDDYVLPRFDFDFFGYIRRNMIQKWMRKSIQCADTLFTISEPMRECYKELFGKDSFVAANMYEPTLEGPKTETGNENIIITYAGGLHYNRHTTILKIVNALRNINNESGFKRKKIILKIYSGSDLKQNIMDKLIASECCVWGGLLEPEELERKLIQSDYLLHVESFKKSNICDTRLSLSTKIPEYMSYNKPIIAVGPKEVASLRYLEDCAWCITNLKSIQEDLEYKLFDKDLALAIADKAYKKYLTNHNKKVIQPEIIKRINEA